MCGGNKPSADSTWCRKCEDSIVINFYMKYGNNNETKSK